MLTQILQTQITPNLKPKNLLDHLSDMESRLDDFYYENFTAKEAEHVKTAFLNFKNTLMQILDPKQGQNTTAESRHKFFKSTQEDKVLETYEAIIEHYESYTDILKSLNIERPMKTAQFSSILSEIAPKSKSTAKPQIDLYPLLEDCMGEMELLEELIKLYEKNALEFIGKAKIQLKAGDFEQLEQSAHKIKAGLAMLKTNDLYSIVLQIEQTCKTDKDAKHLNFLFNCFTDEFPSVQKVLNRSFEHLKKAKN